MRQNLERVTRIIGLLGLSFVGTLSFQNCSGYSAINNPLYDQPSTATCIGVACANDETLLRLTVMNDSPIGLKSAAPSVSATCGLDDSTCVDVGGYCDDGGFPGNRLDYVITTGSTGAVASGSLPSACAQGRWSAQIVLPTTFDYTNMHALTLTLKGLTSDGTAVDSSVGANTRQISLSPYN